MTVAKRFDKFSKWGEQSKQTHYVIMIVIQQVFKNISETKEHNWLKIKTNIYINLTKKSFKKLFYMIVFLTKTQGKQIL